MTRTRPLRPLAVGCAAGFSGDRVDAGVPVVRTLIEHDGPAALIYENLAERTLALQQLARRADPAAGYEPLLELQLRPVLAACLAHGITIVGNFGAANPVGAGRAIERLAAELGLERPRIAIVSGDDLSGPEGQAVLKQQLEGDFDAERFVCANVYQGAQEIADAIRAGAQVVVTGRVADPALVLGPALAHYDWRADEWDALAGATMAGHLLECGAQVSGGYFADPGLKEVPDLDDVGFPIAEIAADGSCVITKAAGTGGCVTERTVKEQLLYELHDPAAYLTPDVVADITEASVTRIGPDRVRLAGVRGHPRTPTLKASLFFDGGWIGEAEISYAGRNAEARARLAMDILRKRIGPLLALRFDLIGVASILGDDAGRLLEARAPGRATDVRLRAAGQHADATVVDRLLREVTALWTCGPAGGGGVRTAKRQRLSMRSCLVPRELAPARFEMLREVEPEPPPSPPPPERSEGPLARDLSLVAKIINPGGLGMIEVPLYEIAHARTGDKGNRSNISLIVYDAKHYPMLVKQVTPKRVTEHFSYRQPGRVQRYLLPNLAAMNFVLDDVLDGGVNDSLNLDMHGKALSYHLLELRVRLDR